jgi:hypothetical protein
MCPRPKCPLTAGSGILNILCITRRNDRIGAQWGQGAATTERSAKGRGVIPCRAQRSYCPRSMVVGAGIGTLGSVSIRPWDISSKECYIQVMTGPRDILSKGRTAQGKLVQENMFGIHCSGTLCLTPRGREVQPGRWSIGCNTVAVQVASFVANKRRNLYCNKYGLILYIKSSFTYIHE